MPDPDEARAERDRDRCDESLARSRRRRALARKQRASRRWVKLTAVVAVPLLAAATALTLNEVPRGPGKLDLLSPARALGTPGPQAGPSAPDGREARASGRGRDPEPVPDAEGAARAREFARSRAGIVAFSAIGSDGRHHDRLADRQFVSASVVKAMLLAAELRRLDDQGLPLDAATRHTLEAMISYSDNAAADAIYYRNGDIGLHAVADAAGMRQFSVAGYWANARVTASDLAGFFNRLDDVFPEEDAEYAKGLLGSIVATQRWGVPEVAGPRGWSVRFKGGWRSTELGQLAHQASELRRGGERISLAILTDGQPSDAYAQETIRGVAQRLLDSGAR